MSGPIIRSRSSQKYAKNFAAAFGGGQAAKKSAGAKSTGAKSAAAKKPSPSKKKT